MALCGLHKWFISSGTPRVTPAAVEAGSRTEGSILASSDAMGGWMGLVAWKKVSYQLNASQVLERATGFNGLAGNGSAQSTQEAIVTADAEGLPSGGPFLAAACPITGHQQGSLFIIQLRLCSEVRQNTSVELLLAKNILLRASALSLRRVTLLTAKGEQKEHTPLVTLRAQTQRIDISVTLVTTTPLLLAAPLALMPTGFLSVCSYLAVVRDPSRAPLIIARNEECSEDK